VIQIAVLLVKLAVAVAVRFVSEIGRLSAAARSLAGDKSVSVAMAVAVAVMAW